MGQKMRRNRPMVKPASGVSRKPSSWERWRPAGQLGAENRNSPARRRRSQEVMGDPFLKQSGCLPGYGIEHEKVIRENKSESGLQKGPALVGIAQSFSRYRQKLAATGMRRLVEVSGGNKTPAQFQASLCRHRPPARGGAAGKYARVVTGMGREVALVPMRAIISNRYARVLRSTAFRM